MQNQSSVCTATLGLNHQYSITIVTENVNARVCALLLEAEEANPAPALHKMGLTEFMRHSIQLEERM
jgi:hypothetical protein